jgi:alkaline phosphatase
MNRFLFLILAIVASYLVPVNSFCQSVENNRPKNIILMIGDGMGINHIHAASYAVPYQLNVMRCTNTAFARTASANDDITDSAAAGTALACGEKTNNGYTGSDSTGKPLKSILKYAEENNLATGIVVTCDITHATPASFYANTTSRYQSDLISRHLIHTGIDIIVGGGYDKFANQGDTLNLIDSLAAEKYEIIRSIDELKGSKSNKIAALLYPKHPPKYTEGRGDMLTVSTAKALDILSKDKDGFFLMVEGSQIDWGGEGNDFDYMINELIDFDKAVGLALDYASKDPETLVIITADHETGGLVLIEDEQDKSKMIPMFSSRKHTGAPVAVFAFGKGAESFSGVIENTDIFKKMLSLYGFTN